MAYREKAFGHYRYSFTVTLFNSELSSVGLQTREVVDVPRQLLIFKDVVRDRKFDSYDESNIIMERHIGRSDEYRQPLILYVTDLTIYERGQPKLELNLDIATSFSEKAERTRPLSELENTAKFVDIFKSYKPNTIHLSFQTKRTRNIDHRKIEMPLPPLETFRISFNLERMMSEMTGI